MLRTFITMCALVLAASLASPLVAEVGEEVERLEIHRELPFQLWKWGQVPSPVESGCGDKPVKTESAVTDWPDTLLKNASFELGGEVVAPAERRGVPGVEVDLFLNETKEEPGVPLGTVTTDAGGRFHLDGTFPAELSADTYHIVAHAKERKIGCKLYQEHWSDPKMDVVSATRIELEVPRSSLVDEAVTLRGQLLDSVDVPVPNATLRVGVAGRTERVVTGEDGTFTLEHTPAREGAQTMDVQFAGSRYYGASNLSTSFPAYRLALLIEGAEDGTLSLERSTPTTLRGQVTDPRIDPREVTLDFDGVGVVPQNDVEKAWPAGHDGLRVVACDDCAATATLRAPVRAGMFEARFVVPADEPLGDFRLRATAPEVEQPVHINGTLLAPVSLSVDVDGSSFAREYDVVAVAADDAGAAAPGRIVVSGPLGDAAVPLSEGEARWHGAAPCGSHPIRVSYEPEGPRQSTETTQDVSVCPLLAWVPAWAWGIPPWLYVAAPLAGVAAVLLLRRVRERRAPVIERGPPVDVRVVEPADAAAAVIGVGEMALIEARPSAPLPEGHRLRFVDHHGAVDATLAPDGRACHTLPADRLGPLAVRVEVLSPRGRVVTRRTVELRAVRYAEEIERLQVEIGRARLGAAAEVTTARQFERWLARRLGRASHAPLGDMARTFEEADYSPRLATRADLLRYLAAAAQVEAAERAPPEAGEARPGATRRDAA